MNYIYPARFAFFLFTFFSISMISAQAPYGNPGDHTPVPFGSSSAPFGYYEYLPLDFSDSSGEMFPLVIFYHGYGERGNGTSQLDDILAFGPPSLIEQGSDFEALVISPQNSDANYSASDFLSLYNYLISNYPIDTNRVYVTGLSSGGGSTWRALQGHYDKIAAAVPICGSGFIDNPSNELQQTPIWAFHSFDDSVISVDNTITNVNRIANINNSVMSVYPYGSGSSAASDDYSMSFDTETQTWSETIGTNQPSDKLSFTLYKDGGHNSWSQTYANQGVWDWMFAQGLGTLNIVDEDITNISFYPNPTSDNITISTNSTVKKTVEMYNLLGEKIYTNLFTDEITVDMSIYASGIYLAKVIGDNNDQKVTKIVVN